MTDSNFNPYAQPQASVDMPDHSVGHFGGRFFDPKGRGQVAIGFIWLAAATSVLATVATALVYPSIQQAGTLQAGPDSITQAELVTAGLVMGGASLLQLGALIGAVISFCMWFYRAYANLQALQIETVHSPGWAPGSFFVPILNLVRPYQIAKEIHDKLAPVHDEQSSRKFRSGSKMIGYWWACYLISGILGWISAKAMDRAFTVYLVFGLLSLALTIAAAYFIMKIIRLINRLETSAHRNRSEPLPSTAR